MSERSQLKGASIRARRRGQKGWATRRQIADSFALALADQTVARELVAIAKATEGWVITRTARDGVTATLTFQQFRLELMMWTESPSFRGRVRNPAFCVFEDMPLSRSLKEILETGARIVTEKAEYRLAI